MADSPYTVRITRPNSTAHWSFDTYEGPTGSALHHVYMKVHAGYQATRPDANGLPNRITIEREQDCRTESIHFERTSAQALVDMLTEALAWVGDSEDG